MRPGMYIGKLGDGSSSDDGIYVLLKEVIDNSIDEFMEGHGRTFDITIKEKRASVRDYGRGIPLNKVVDCVSRMNTGGKFKDGSAFEVSIGMNGVGVKAVNALSTDFVVQSVRDGQLKRAEFSCGKLVKDHPITPTDEKNGTLIEFLPDNTIFENFDWYNEYIDKLLWNYVYLNRGLTINFNGKKYVSKNGLLDLLNKATGDSVLYQPIYLKEDDFEFATQNPERTRVFNTFLFDPFCYVFRRITGNDDRMTALCWVLNIITPGSYMSASATDFNTFETTQKIDYAFCRRLQSMVTRNALFAVGLLDEH